MLQSWDGSKHGRRISIFHHCALPSLHAIAKGWQCTAVELSTGTFYVLLWNFKTNIFGISYKYFCIPHKYFAEECVVQRVQSSGKPLDGSSLQWSWSTGIFYVLFWNNCWECALFSACRVEVSLWRWPGSGRLFGPIAFLIGLRPVIQFQHTSIFWHFIQIFFLYFTQILWYSSTQIPLVLRLAELPCGLDCDVIQCQQKYFWYFIQILVVFCTNTLVFWHTNTP